MASIEPGAYQLVLAADTGLVIEAAGWDRNSLRDGTNCQVISRGWADGRIWVVSYDDDGESMRLVNRLSGKALDAAGTGTHSAGDNVQIWTDHGGRNQRWKATDTGGTIIVEGESYPTYYLQLNGESLNVAANAASSQSNVVLKAPANNNLQKWAFVPLPPLVSGAVYELVSIAKKSTQLAVYSGWQKQDGNRVGAHSIVHDWDDQKWLLEDTGSGWTLWNILAERYAVVLDAAIKNGQPVVAWSGGSENKLWKVERYANAEIEGISRPVIAFGAANETNFALTRDSNGLGSIRTWGQGINEQRWALVPTWACDQRLPAPYNLGNAPSVGSSAEATCTAQWGASMNFSMIPCWECVPSLATPGANSYQMRMRTRKMSSASDTWDSWTTWSEWDSVPVTRDGQRYWLTQGYSVSMTDDYKLAQLEYEVRTCVAVEGTLRYGASDAYTITCYPIPTVSLSNPTLTADGLVLEVASNYDAGSTTIDFGSISDADGEILAAPMQFDVTDGTITIPYSAMLRVPEAAALVSASYKVGTDQKRALANGTMPQEAVLYDGDYTAETVGLEDTPDMTIAATPPDGYASQVWIAVNGKRIECPLGADGTFQVTYPFGVPYTVYAAGVDSDGNWYVWSAENEGAPGMHAWNFDGGSAVLEVREGQAHTTEDSIEAVYESNILDARLYEAVSFAATRKHHFSVEGAVIDGVTESQRNSFELLAGRHATYRSPKGDIVPVAVVSVSRVAHRQWTEINVSMVREG